MDESIYICTVSVLRPSGSNDQVSIGVIVGEEDLMRCLRDGATATEKSHVHVRFSTT